MAFDIVPHTFWRWPAMWEDEDELSWPAFSTQSGVSVSEDERHVYVTANLPGIDEKDIDVTFDKGVLWVKGEAKEEEEDKKRKFYRRSASSFSYRVAVPGDIDVSADPDTSYKHGRLTVTFTKSPKSQPKKIAVKSGK